MSYLTRGVWDCHIPPYKALLQGRVARTSEEDSLFEAALTYVNFGRLRDAYVRLIRKPEQYSLATVRAKRIMAEMEKRNSDEATRIREAVTP